ncbi:hypothetical protein LWI29_020359 [Acer saccharum]|uniref:Uncharacterized protein n=1 Tax=Acer saccharum TaxID=4024 RepID=A0AA39RWS7_ACESA|nr:hypothetical protein LWI29_020359 [Acer saccharum]
MATTSLLKANQLLFSSRRQNFHENPCFIRSTKLVINRRFHGFKAKSFLDSTPSASNTGKNKTAAFPFKFEAKTTSTGSVSKGNNFYDEVVFSTILKTLKWLKVPAVVILLLFVSMYGRDPALAARSGGAMGGSSFSSSSSSSPKSSSSSSSSRSSSSRSGSGSGSGSGSSSSSYRSSSGSSSGSGSGSSSSSYRSSSGSSSGSSRSGGVMGGHSFSSSSSSKPSSSSSSSSLSPSSSSSSSNDYHSYISSSTETRPYSPDWYSSSSYHTSSSSSPSATATDKMMTKPKVQERAQVQRELSKEEIQEIWHALINVVIILLALIVLYVMLSISVNKFNNWREALENRTRVIKLQVKVNESMEEAEEYFKKLSIDEREKYDKETLINLDNVKSDSISDQKDNNMSRDRDTYMVVTILVAAKGKAALNFPNRIASKEDLKEAFKELQIISKSAEVQAVNVVWTPQDENEVMSREELYQVYPTLLKIGGDS